MRFRADDIFSNGRHRAAISFTLKLSFFVIIVFSMFVDLCASTSSVDNVRFDKQIRENIENAEFKGEDPTKIVRRYRLYNRCSGGYLQMYLNQVNARGKYFSPLVDLRVESDSYGSRIRIQSDKFGKYLCFNRRKKIISRYNGKHKRCIFVERLSENHYTELESAWSAGLYLGFNNRGRFIEPRRYKEQRYCFQYIKTEQVTFIERFEQATNRNMNSAPFLNSSVKRALYSRRKSRRRSTMMKHRNSTAHNVDSELT